MTSQSRLRGVVLIGGDSRATIEQVVRALPPIDAAFLLSCDVDAPGLAALRRASTMPIVEALDGAASRPARSSSSPAPTTSASPTAT